MTSLRLSALMSTPTTFAPPAAHFSAISLPKPLPAPVTMTTLSLRYCDIPTLPIQSEKPSVRLPPTVQPTPLNTAQVVSRLARSDEHAESRQSSSAIPVCLRYVSTGASTGGGWVAILVMSASSGNGLSTLRMPLSLPPDELTPSSRRSVSPVRQAIRVDPQPGSTPLATGYIHDGRPQPGPQAQSTSVTP